MNGGFILHEDIITLGIEVSSFSWTQQSVSLTSPEVGNRWSFRNVVFSSIYISGRWTKSRHPVILNVFVSLYVTVRHFPFSHA
jgi:hypothetical protein